MHSATLTAPLPRARISFGHVLSGVGVLFMTVDALVKLAPVQAVVDAFGQMGYPVSLAPVIGLIALACLALYLIPATAGLGAILLTAYLGGAVASHLRIGSPLLTHTLFPVFIAAMLWGGLILRDPAIRALLIKRP